ncbi:MAG: type IV pilus secretin PilQ [Moraxellaceae bacterium]|nr:MAG: type IV pilus secretin PilQ [Moraxellaceae bacterium]
MRRLFKKEENLFLNLRLIAWVAITLSMSMSGSAWAAKLIGLESSALPGDALEIKFTFDSVPPLPTGYTIETPARIALDLKGVESALAEKHHGLGNGNVRSATVMGAGDRTRIIINMTSLVAYNTEVVGNTLRVRVGQSVRAKSSASAVATSSMVSGGFSAKSTKPSITELDFRRGEQGEGMIILTVSDPSAAIDLREEAGSIVAEFVGVSLPDMLRRRLDVIDFATPVSIVEAISESGNAKISITATGDYEYLAYQTDSQFTISVKPVIAEEVERKRKEKFQFTGEKLSLNFQDIEVRSVLQLIADFTELNLVASDTVSGRITLRLQNVPWDQALDLILKTKGLSKRKVGNVMLVAPADEIAAREKQELEANKQVEELAPINTEYLVINYAKASDIQALLTVEEAGFLSGRGSVSVDERTNTLIVQDTSAKLSEIRFMLEQLDVPVRQVMIEARIVIAKTDAAEELGVQWGIIGADESVSSIAGQSGTVFFTDKMSIIGGGRAGLQQNVNSITTKDTDGFGDFTIGNGNNLALNLGLENAAASRISLGFFDSATGLIDLELSALESEGKAEIVSTPKVLTADQQTARISSGKEIPYQEASASGATTTAFKEAVLSLEVTPQITPEGRVIMELIVNQDTVGALDQVSGIPIIDTNEITTSVIVDNGQTVVLGGVFQSQEIESVQKTPFLGDLPVIGRLFRRNISKLEKTELLIFITPKIIHDVTAAQ